MVTAECHAHIFMDGVDYKKAAAAHENGPREDLSGNIWRRIRRQGFPMCVTAGIRTGRVFLYGALRRSTESHTAPQLLRLTTRGVIKKKSDDAHHNTKEHCALVREVRRAGGDFIKIMTTGILDFATRGHVTSELLSREEVFAITAAAHDAGGFL